MRYVRLFCNVFMAVFDAVFSPNPEALKRMGDE
jgi:hypothetical protein